jgi:two-component system, OmpR family, osmolarity sensor histidine kinase EnvZ
MTAQLSKVETDRTVMLAGISHDLRTPLARLRLETELSVSDSDARTEMSLDIEQINSILSKFLDYARPHVVELQDVNLSNVVSATANAVNNSAKVSMDIVASYFVPEDLQVMADPVELSRVLNNLLENARRYGKSTVYPENIQNNTRLLPLVENDSHDDAAWQPTRMFDEPVEIAQVHIDARIEGEWVVLSIKDNGNGVAPEVLNQLNVPFFRANEARTNTTGTGLGLAIVEKAVQGMQGKVKLSNWGVQAKDEDARLDNANKPEGGFMVEIRLKRPPHKIAAQKAKAAQSANQMANKVANQPKLAAKVAENPA